MRGQKEKECLNVVTQSIFCNPRQNFDDYELKFENAFGFTQEDEREFLNIFRTIQANPKSSEFPDFVFDNGFIEHFQITSSRENRHGATEAKERAEFQQRIDKDRDEIRKNWEITSSDKVRSNRWTRENSEHSYQFLVKSFKDNWQRHIKSLDKYNGSTKVGIFMVENNESALSMIEDLYAGLGGISPGDLREQQSFNYFRLSRDKYLLNYIYGFKEKIKYIIYVYQDFSPERKNYEIIKLESIPYLLKLLPWDFRIVPTYAINVTADYNVCIEFAVNQNKDEK